MSRAFLMVVFSLVLILCFPDSALGQPPTRSGYRVAWFDEFSGVGIDLAKWTPGNTSRPTNNSLQDYLPEQVTVSDGQLVIASENVASRGLPFRSGLVRSTALQKYGRWDVRAKLPTSTGMWPAIWLLPDAPWPGEGEIDIMENRGDQPLMTSSAFHYGTNQPYEHNFVISDQASVHNNNPENYHDSFHTYSVEWDPGQVRFYVDDVHHWTVRDSEVGGFLTNHVGGMRLVINTAIGGDFLNDPDGSTVWPQEFRIDYVHAYTRSATEPTLWFENGGFENLGGSLSQWTKFGDAINNVSSGNEQVRTGDGSLKLSGQCNGADNFSGVEQGLSVSGGDKLIASADALVVSGDSIAGSDNQVFLRIDYYNELYGAFESSEYIRSDSMLLADGSTLNDAWLNHELISIAPAGAVEARVALVFGQNNDAGGAVFIDNVEFSQIAVPERWAAWVWFVILGLSTVLVLSAVVFGVRSRRH